MIVMFRFVFVMVYFVRVFYYILIYLYYIMSLNKKIISSSDFGKRVLVRYGFRGCEFKNVNIGYQMIFILQRVKNIEFEEVIRSLELEL